MAKRKTIGDNPLDAGIPNPQSSTTASPASARRPVQPSPSSRKPERGAATPAQVAPSQAPPQNNLLSRIQSLEEQNAWIKWLAYGAIGLALLL